MKQQILDCFAGAAERMQCPLCAGAFSLQGVSLRCTGGHSYDLSGRGYVNLAPQQRASRYTKALFQSRRAVFEAGLYESLVQCLRWLMKEYAPPAEPKLLDAGCGEGYFLRQMGQCLPAHHLYGLDLAKQGVQMAASASSAAWMVADLTKLPFIDGSIDVLLNILSPAHYAEFSRVMGPGALLLKVIPGSGYLLELRRAAKGQLRREDYHNDEVLALLERHYDVLETHRIQYQEQPDEATKRHLVEMTPLLLGVDHMKIDIAEIDKITMDVHVVAARAKR